MTETLLKRTQFGLQADSEDAYKLLGNIPVGTMVVADIRDQRRRSTDQHRFWFSMVNTLYESQEYYKKFDTFRHSLLVVMGYCDEHKLKGGRIYYEPHSLAFGSMEQSTFTNLVNDTLDFAENLGFNRAELLKFTRDRAGMAA